MEIEKLFEGITKKIGKTIYNLVVKSVKPDYRLTPRPELDMYFGFTQPGIRVPEISPSLPLIKYVHDNSPPLKIATLRLRESIFRRGFDWSNKFQGKCPKCEKEYNDNTVEYCDECNTKVIKPDETEKQYGENFFKTCTIKENSRSKRTFLHLLKQIEDDINIYDDAYIIGIKEYWQDDEGNIKFETLHEILRGNPVNMRIVADEYGQKGGKWATCLRHRDVIEDISDVEVANDKKCPKCGRFLYDVHYVAVQGDKPNAYYIDDEIIHNSKYMPSELYGFSPIVTLWQYTLTITNMIEYVYRSYTEQHLPKGVLAMKTSNPDSAFELWRDIDDKLQKNPHYIPKIFLEGDGQGSGSGMEFIKFMDTLEEMQYIPIRDEIRRTIAAMYGITNIFIGDLSGVGGLNSESEQVQITNMAAESSMVIYNENIFPRILKWLHINDWDYVVNSPFEEDNTRELNETLMNTQIAQNMLAMGFDVKLDTSTGEFIYSGEAKKQQTFGDTIGGGGENFGGGFAENQDNLNLGKEIKKVRRYIKNPSNAPKGAAVHQGKRGGYWYETEPRSSSPEEIPEYASKLKESIEGLTYKGRNAENFDEFNYGRYTFLVASDDVPSQIILKFDHVINALKIKGRWNRNPPTIKFMGRLHQERVDWMTINGEFRSSMVNARADSSKNEISIMDDVWVGGTIEHEIGHFVFYDLYNLKELNFDHTLSELSIMSNETGVYNVVANILQKHNLLNYDGLNKIINNIMSWEISSDKNIRNVINELRENKVSMYGDGFEALHVLRYRIEVGKSIYPDEWEKREIAAQYKQSIKKLKANTLYANWIDAFGQEGYPGNTYGSSKATEAFAVLYSEIAQIRFLYPEARKEEMEKIALKHPKKFKVMKEIIPNFIKRIVEKRG